MFHIFTYYPHYNSSLFLRSTYTFDPLCKLIIIALTEFNIVYYSSERFNGNDKPKTRKKLTKLNLVRDKAGKLKEAVGIELANNSKQLLLNFSIHKAS